MGTGKTKFTYFCSLRPCSECILTFTEFLNSLFIHFALLIFPYPNQFIMNIIDFDKASNGVTQQIFTSSKSAIETLEKKCKIRSKLTIKTLERRENTSDVVLVSFLLNLNIFYTFFYCFYC